MIELKPGERPPTNIDRVTVGRVNDEQWGVDWSRQSDEKEAAFSVEPLQYATRAEAITAAEAIADRYRIPTIYAAKEHGG